METSTSRVFWKGAISFGLVHVPVALHSATSESGLDFDWLDKRTMDPICYKRINKKTGKEVEKENIVKGISYAEGHYVVLTEVEPGNTRTADIVDLTTLLQRSLHDGTTKSSNAGKTRSTGSRGAKQTSKSKSASRCRVSLKERVQNVPKET